MAEVVWIDGAPVPAALARVPVFDRGFLYGDSVYEVLRVYRGRPFLLAEHLDRLERSADAIGLPLPPSGEIGRALDETLATAAEPEAYVRIVVTRGAGDIALDPAAADAPRLVIIVRRVGGPSPEQRAHGVELATWGRSRGGAVDARVKSGNYLGSVLATGEAKRRGAYEALLCDAVGRVTEGSSSNLFIARGGRLVTPPLSLGLLEGITRRAVIALSRAAGVAVDEQLLWPVDVRRADEAFITSSIREVVPVVRLDGQPIGGGRPGPLTERVAALYRAEVDRATGAAG